MRPAPALFVLVLGTITLTPTQTRVPEPAPPESRVIVHAEGRGAPWLKLDDGREVPAVHRGPARLKAALAEASTRSAALATADFDEDGVPDVLASYVSSGTGILALHRGNIDAIYPNEPGAKERKANGTFVDAPFLPDVHLFGTPGAPDFLEAGDFDADGHWDVVAAELGRDTLILHLGDGQGGFAEPEEIALPGVVTAMVAGEINRRDGLLDLVVAIVGSGGPMAIIFEGPRGALRWNPESIPLPAPATDLVLGRFDNHFARDLAVASGRDLLIVHGRDRRLSLEERQRAEVPAATVHRILLPFVVSAMTSGDFDDDDEVDLALLGDDGWLRVAAAKDPDAFSDEALHRAEATPLAGMESALLREADDTSTGIASGRRSERGGSQRVRLASVKTATRPGDEIVMIDAPGRGLHLMMSAMDPTGPEPPIWIHMDVEGSPVALLPMRLNGDALQDLVILSDGPGSISTMESSIASLFVVTNTSDSGPGSLREAITQANATAGADTISFDISGPGPHTIQVLSDLPRFTETLTIDGTTQPGYAGTPLIELDGSLVTPAFGLRVWASLSTVRGLAIGNFSSSSTSVIDGGVGLDLSGSCVDCLIEGNYLGTDATGVTEAPLSRSGIRVSGPNVTVGGTTSAARNVITSRSRHISMLETADGIVIQGNYIGVDATGAAPFPSNGRHGIHTSAIGGILSNVTIGGVLAGAGNVISGSQFNGVHLIRTSDLLVQGNLIGTDATGMLPIGNSGSGVNLDLDTSGTVGGTTVAARNVISANGGFGIIMTGGFVVQGNYIGVAADGATPMGNNNNGLRIQLGGGNTVGGDGVGANVISGNQATGLHIVGSDSNFVLGNMIGTDWTGIIDVGNGNTGIALTGFFGASGTLRPSFNNQIGGSSSGSGNVISGNDRDGVLVADPNGTGNIVAGNRIGTDASGTALISNFLAGVKISDATGVVIGGPTPAHGNQIAGTDVGIVISGPDARANRVQSNLIGTNASGTAVLGSLTEGVSIFGGANGNEIGVDIASPNLISGSATGVWIIGSTLGGGENRVRGNLIGTDITGTLPLGNGLGVYVLWAPANTIGGASASEGNIISGNSKGVLIEGTDTLPAKSNLVAGNLIGTDITGTGPLSNGTYGIKVDGAIDTQIGEPLLGGWPNTIAFNGAEGIVVASGTGSRITENRIFANATLGIDLGGDGVTANDTGDPDVGANALQNFPVITTVSTTGGSVTIDGTLNSTPGTTFEIHFYRSVSCDPSGHGEAEGYVGMTMVSTDGAGNAGFSASFPVGVPAGEFITATATTSPSVGTSEFSSCTSAAGVPPPPVMAMTIDESGPGVIDWEPSPGATLYHVYLGGSANFELLRDQSNDSCRAGETQTDAHTIPVTRIPPPGEFLWWVVRPEGSYGLGEIVESPDGKARIHLSTGDCGASCVQDKCTTGQAMDSACDPAAASVCGTDSFCCTNTWDSLCVQEVRTIAGSLVCSESQGQCSHTLCSEGAPLTQSCDSPPASTSCVDRICSVDPFCCSNSWDSLCVERVATVCGMNCN